MIIILLPIYAILGFVAVLTRNLITGHMRQDWRDISNRTLGILYVFPLALFLFDHLAEDIPRQNLRFLVAYFLAFGSFGFGVVTGYWYMPSDSDEEI